MLDELIAGVELVHLFFIEAIHKPDISIYNLVLGQQKRRARVETSQVRPGPYYDQAGGPKETGLCFITRLLLLSQFNLFFVLFFIYYIIIIIIIIIIITYIIYYYKKYID